jgi:DNA adenine methylase
MRLRNPSPLRYPGGKSSLASVLESIIYANDAQGCTYVEPFAGGAGAAIKLLRGGHVDRIVINDADRAIYCFWNSVMRHTEALVERVLTVPLTIEEWRRQKAIYDSPARRPQLDIGFAAFYLNRCNRSGIIMNGGPIGGIAQAGKWRIDARFNRKDLANRVRELAEYGNRIIVLQLDALQLISGVAVHVGKDRCFMYVDPPYYVKGRELYLSHYADVDHVRLACAVKLRSDIKWVMTYDDVPRVRQLYEGMNVRPFRLRYSAHHSSASGGEVLISPAHVHLPRQTDRLLGLANASLEKEAA